MTRKKTLTSATIALCSAVTGLGLIGFSASATASETSSAAATVRSQSSGSAITGARTITVDGHSVKVSCSGEQVEDQPVVVLLHGGGDDLTTMADFQETLSAHHRVCSYDRLGAGGSDAPAGLQDYDDVGVTLTGVLEQVAANQPVVLVGHSMGGLLAARYAPDHKDRVKGLVLLDSTSPTAVADVSNRIPDSATGVAGEVRAQTLAIFAGENPEKLVFTDGKVRSAGHIPVRAIQHGKRYLAEIPQYGPGLEKDWTKGQKRWMALSTRSTRSAATDSGHYIHVEAPAIAVKAVERVVAQVD